MEAFRSPRQSIKANSGIVTLRKIASTFVVQSFWGTQSEFTDTVVKEITNNYIQ
jgi:hypothetical protein